MRPARTEFLELQSDRGLEPKRERHRYTAGDFPLTRTVPSRIPDPCVQGESR